MNRAQGAHLERLASLYTGIKQTPGSGCGLIFKGDLNSDDWFIEVKSTRSKKLTLNSEWWFKAQAQAREKLKPNVALVIGWTTRNSEYSGSLQFAVVGNYEGPTEFDLVLKGKTKSLPMDKLTSLGDTKIAKITFKDASMAYLMPMRYFELNYMEQQ